jgi:hypothetical protein
MISDITNKLSTNKNTIKGLMKNIIDDSETRRIMINVIDKTFNDILDGSMIIKVPKPDKDLVVSRSELAQTTKAFTKLLNRFYQIEASETTSSLVEETKAKQAKMSGKETALESGRSGGSSSPQMTGGEGGDLNAQLLLQYLPQFTKKLNELRDALGQLDLSGSSAGGGLAAEVMDEAGDALGGRRGRRRPDTDSGPSPRGGGTKGGPRPSQAAGGGGGAGLLKLIALGTAIGLAPKAYEVASSAFSAGTNFLSNTIQSVAKKAESILASIGQAAGGLIDAGGAALGAGSGEYSAVGAGGQGAWASDAPFIEAVNNVAQKYNIDANDLIGLMHSESGVNPQARNASGATGLIQFMPRTARGIGTSVEALYGMNRAQQMVWVDRYFAANRLPRGATAGNLYTSVFLPKYTNRPPNFVVARRGGANDAGDNANGSWYTQNSGLDATPADGAITIAELGARISRKRQEIGLGPSRTAGGFRAAVNTIGNAATNVGNAASNAVSNAATAVAGAVPAVASSIFGTAENWLGRSEGNSAGQLNQFISRYFGPFDVRRTPWCAAFLNAVLGSQGIRGTGLATAVSFRNFGGLVWDRDVGGNISASAKGDIGYFRRPQGTGHVAFIDSINVGAGTVTYVGGNQSDRNSGGQVSKKTMRINDPRYGLMAVRRVGGSGGGPIVGPAGPAPGSPGVASAPVENPASAFAQRLIAALDERLPIPATAARRLPEVAATAAVNRRLNDTPRVVVVDRPIAQPSPPPAVTSLGNTQTPPRSNPDLATQYRVYFGVA